MLALFRNSLSFFPRCRWIYFGAACLPYAALLREMADVAIRHLSLNHFQLQSDRKNIIWNFMPQGKFTIGSAYHAQFIGSKTANFKRLIWKVWAPPKCKFFGWLAIQNRIWTSDRLQARAWPNNGVCPLCRHSQESRVHLFQDCRYTKRIWGGIAMWLGNEHLRPSI